MKISVFGGTEPIKLGVTALQTPPPMTPYGAAYVAPTSLKRRASATARDAIRHFGTATARWRILPDYLIIGTKRGGTTSLARWLLDHPGVASLFPARERRKGTYYFDVNYARGESWYRSHFPTRMSHTSWERIMDRQVLIGEATPYYLYHPHAPERAHQLVPQVKVIALLRNPVDRAHGHWAERSRQGVETLDFEAALDAEPERLAGEEAKMLADPSYNSFAHQHWSYLDQGRYARGLSRWMDHFASEQLLVLRSEDLYSSPLAVYGQVLEFLGLEPYKPSELTAWNKRSRSPIEPVMRERLGNTLAPDVAELEQLLGRPMGWI